MHEQLKNRIIRQPQGFELGLTTITRIEETEQATQMNFSILKLAPAQSFHIKPGLETACLLMTGELHIETGEQSLTFLRNHLFDDPPVALHLSTTGEALLSARTHCEIAVIQTINEREFSTQIFTAENMLENEHRGQGLLNNTSYRIVRTIFDKRNRPDAELVLGEVINFPGCWSSYPPHYHPQPEIYHYRFTEPQGYGHGELGDDVFKTENFMTVKILDSQVHSQTAAPGYGLYYIWAIKHLPGQPYNVPTFEKAHAWTKTVQANDKVWKGATPKQSHQQEEVV